MEALNAMLTMALNVGADVVASIFPATHASGMVG
jgi:hypothetical protein